MAGFNELVEELARRFPEDWWIVSRRETESLIPDAFPQVEIYEKALKSLDEQSWRVLTEKALAAFREPRSDRGKNQFFNLLNEALGYEYLVGKGLRNVKLLPANPKAKTPDISCEEDGELRFCEVKTIGVSQEELDRSRSGDVFSGEIYLELNQQFLAKLRATIDGAREQLSAAGGGMLYLIVHFDDFTLDYYETYQRQVREFLASEYPGQDAVVRVGIANARYIRHPAE